MTHQQAQEILDKIMGQVFGYQNPYDLAQFMQKFAFDVKLPLAVNDSTTGEQTWAQSMNPTKFITMNNALNGPTPTGENDWMLPKQELNTMEDILATWNRVNYTTTERAIESQGVSESDNVYNSENVYRSQDVHKSKNVLFCDSCNSLEYCAAVQRSSSSTYSIRVEDSKEVTSSFSVQWSAKVSNSMFIHDCFDVYECLFCSHVTGKKFCIANIQFSEEEYMKIKDMVVRWALNN